MIVSVLQFQPTRHAKVFRSGLGNQRRQLRVLLQIIYDNSPTISPLKSSFNKKPEVFQRPSDTTNYFIRFFKKTNTLKNKIFKA